MFMFKTELLRRYYISIKDFQKYDRIQFELLRIWEKQPQSGKFLLVLQL